MNVSVPLLVLHLLCDTCVPPSAADPARYEIRRYARDKLQSKVHQRGMQEEAVNEIVEIAQQMLLPALVPKMLAFTEKSSSQVRAARGGSVSHLPSFGHPLPLC